MKPVKHPHSGPKPVSRGARRVAMSSSVTTSPKRHTRPDKKLRSARIALQPIAAACHFKVGDAVVWLRTRVGEYGRVAPMLGRVERVAADQCSIRVYDTVRKAWVNSTVPADELDAATVPEITRLAALERP